MKRIRGHAFAVLISAVIATPSPTCSASETNSNQITWLEQQVTSSGLVVAYDDGHDSAPLYANCLAVIAFSHSGKLDKARNILGALLNVYETSTTEGKSQNPGGLLFDQRSAADPIGSASGDFRTGENAWLVIAINYYETLTHDDQYSTFATDLLDAVLVYREDSPTTVSYGAFKWGPGDDTFAAEFQIDIYSALNVRANLSADPAYTQYAADLRNFLLYDQGWPPVLGETKVWIPFAEPVFNGHIYDGITTPIYLDNQAWAVLALYPPQSGEVDFTQAIQHLDTGEVWNMTATVNCEGTTITAFSDEFMPGGEAPDWVWLEGTEIAAAAYKLTGEDQKSSHFHELVSSLAKPDGSIYHSCSTDGKYPNDFWPKNYRFPAVTTTCWNYFVQAEINPFQPKRPARAENSWILY